MKNLALIEDHHQALEIWKNLKIKNLPLVHLDRLILEADLNKKKGHFKKALILYKESVMFAGGNIKIYDNAFKMLRVEKDKELFKFFEHSYKTF